MWNKNISCEDEVLLEELCQARRARLLRALKVFSDEFLKVEAGVQLFYTSTFYVGVEKITDSGPLYLGLRCRLESGIVWGPGVLAEVDYLDQERGRDYYFILS